MAKLTSVRVNGIRGGYWSASKKEELVQRLGDLEHKAPRMLERLCDNYCKHAGQGNSEIVQKICDDCPMNSLMRMVGES